MNEYRIFEFVPKFDFVLVWIDQFEAVSFSETIFLPVNGNELCLSIE